MKKISSLVLACVTFVSVCSYTPAFAFDVPGAYTFTLGGGGIYFSSKRHIDNTGFTFGTVGYDFTEHWGIETMLGFFSTNSRLPVNMGKQVNGTLFAIDGVYNFTPFHSIEPFILFGPGATDLNPNGTDANAEGNLNGVVGVKIFADNIVAFRMEARDFYTYVGGKNDMMLDAGVTFLLDKC